MARKATRYIGVYSRTSESRRHEGRPDVCFDISYKIGRRKVWEKVGWKSEGVTAGYASRLRTERMQESRLGKVVKKARVRTLDEAFELYREAHLASTKSERRIVGMYYAGVSPVFGREQLHRIGTLDIQKFVTSLVGRRAAATIRHYVSIIRVVYRKLILWGEYSGDVPTDGVVMPRVDNQRGRYLTQEEAARLMEGLRNRSEDTYRIAVLSLYTGMRAGEIFGLRGEDIDLAEGTISIKNSKNGRARTAYMTKVIREMFDAMELIPGRPVFPARDGGVRKEVPDTFERAVDELGLNDSLADVRDRVVFHTLRHTYATWLVSEGVPLYTVSKLLGHSTLKMTERYAKHAPEAKRKAVEVLNGMLDNYL